MKYNRTIRFLEEYHKTHHYCEICGKEETANIRRRLAYDHNHDTNEFRGMLCFRCNVTLDYFLKHKSAFIAYSKR